MIVNHSIVSMVMMNKNNQTNRYIDSNEIVGINSSINNRKMDSQMVKVVSRILVMINRMIVTANQTI